MLLCDFCLDVSPLRGSTWLGWFPTLPAQSVYDTPRLQRWARLFRACGAGLVGVTLADDAKVVDELVNELERRPIQAGENSLNPHGKGDILGTLRLLLGRTAPSEFAQGDKG